mmetsp:Transcript_54516/g.145473  ORF Transcript_54516/g.145473 Transcript_54516/m.145473 type:complete len:200 (-) Transcript_54516:780-1379(-)
MGPGAVGGCVFLQDPVDAHLQRQRVCLQASKGRVPEGSGSAADAACGCVACQQCLGGGKILHRNRDGVSRRCEATCGQQPVLPVVHEGMWAHLDSCGHTSDLRGRRSRCRARSRDTFAGLLARLCRAQPTKASQRDSTRTPSDEDPDHGNRSHASGAVPPASGARTHLTGASTSAQLGLGAAATLLCRARRNQPRGDVW